MIKLHRGRLRSYIHTCVCIYNIYNIFRLKIKKKRIKMDAAEPDIVFFISHILLLRKNLAPTFPTEQSFLWHRWQWLLEENIFESYVCRAVSQTVASLLWSSCRHKHKHHIFTSSVFFQSKHRKKPWSLKGSNKLTCCVLRRKPVCFSARLGIKKHQSTALTQVSPGCSLPCGEQGHQKSQPDSTEPRAAPMGQL